MTSLVTGGTGFVGSHVAKLLVERGENVRALVRANSRRDNLAGLDSRLLEMVAGDLNDAESLKQALRGCDTLYHVAADYRLWSRNPQELYDSNVGGTRRIYAGRERRGNRENRVYQHGRSAGKTYRRFAGKRNDASCGKRHDRALQTLEVSGGSGGAGICGARFACHHHKPKHARWANRTLNRRRQARLSWIF